MLQTNFCLYQPNAKSILFKFRIAFQSSIALKFRVLSIHSSVEKNSIASVFDLHQLSGMNFQKRE